MPGVRGSVIPIAGHDLCVAPSTVGCAMAAVWLSVVSERYSLNLPGTLTDPAKTGGCSTEKGLPEISKTAAKDMLEAETAQRSLDSAMKNGENIKGRSFHGTGKEAVPIISEEDDKTEYEYYEYNYPETEKNSGDSIIERYYFKDGDVFAIYTKATWGDTVIEDTEVIKSISGDIPDGTFELPDLSGYEKKEF